MRYLLLFLLFSVYSFAQDPYYISINKSNGLPSNSVYDIYQDSKQFIWFATSKGICRIDGTQIKHFNSNQITTRAVSNLYEDDLGRIWYQDFNGTIYYIQNEVIHQFQQAKANGYLRYGFINNKIFVATKNSIKIYDSVNFELLKSIPTDLKDIKQTIVHQDYFYIVGKRIIGYNIDGESHEIKLPAEHSHNNVAPLLVNYKNELFIFSKYHNYYYKIKEQKISVHTSPIDSKFIQNIIAIDDCLWICSTNGVFKLNPQTNSYKHYYMGDNISCALKTNNNKYWFSTLDEGTFLVNDIESIYIKTAHSPTKLLSQEDAIYFGSNKDEIFKIDSQHKLYSTYKGDSEHYIQTAYVNAKDEIIITGSSQLTIKTKKGTLKSPMAVKDIYRLDHKYYLISATTWSGVIYFDPTLKSSFDSYFSTLPYRQENGIHFLTIIDIEDGKSCAYNPFNQTLYFTTNYGIKSYKSSEKKIIQTPSGSNFNKIVVVKDKVFCIDDNEIVYSIDEKNQAIEFEFPDDFKNSSISRIRSYKDELYLIKENGIYCYNATTQRITKILELPKDSEFIDITKQYNNYYISLNEGIIISAVKKIIPNKVHLYLGQIFVNNQNVDLSKLNSLKHDENNIDINFSLATETLDNNYKLLYRINQNPWESLNLTTQSIKLSSLAYGKHNLQIRLINGEQQINEDIPITIAYPFWLKWWFLLLIITLLCALIYMYFKYQIRIIHKKNRLTIEKIKLEKSLNQSKIKALKSQMNPHFFFNALNTLQSYILDNDKTNAIFYLSKFSKLTRTILEMSEKDYVNLSEEISTLTIYLDIEQSRFSGDFQYHIHIDEDLTTNELYIPSLLLQPHVENAIKHGLLHKEGEKHIDIKFIDKPDYILVSIEDNGIGRKRSGELNAIKNQNHKSFATESLQERIDLINVNLKKKITLQYIDKENSKGTIVLINIPKRKY